MIIGAVAFYENQFGPVLSSKQEVWGQFGDYIGGVLNPALSFLALIALLITITQQSKQLHISSRELELTRNELALTKEEIARAAQAAAAQADHFHRSELREDINRIIVVIVGRIDVNLNQGRAITDLGSEQIAIRSIIEMYDHVDWESHVKTAVESSHRPGSRVGQAAGALAHDLDTLAKYIEEYESVSSTSRGSTPIRSFYVAEYGWVAEGLYRSGLLSKPTPDGSESHPERIDRLCQFYWY